MTTAVVQDVLEQVVAKPIQKVNCWLGILVRSDYISMITDGAAMDHDDTIIQLRRRYMHHDTK